MALKGDIRSSIFILKKWYLSSNQTFHCFKLQYQMMLYDAGISLISDIWCLEVLSVTITPISARMTAEVI